MRVMARDTVLVPDHLLQLLFGGHDPRQVLELLDTYDQLQRLQRQDARRGRRWRRPGAIAEVVPLFPVRAPADVANHDPGSAQALAAPRDSCPSPLTAK